MKDWRYTLKQGDCLELMGDIPDGLVDMVLCDLPYGITACKWDTVIPFEPLWAHYKRVIKPNGAIVLFGKEPFSSLLRTSNLALFKYDWIWRKDTKSNFMQADYQPLNNLEIISVFSGGYARNNPTGNMMVYNPQFNYGVAYKIPKQSSTTAIFGANHKNGKYLHKVRDTSNRYPFNLLDFKTDKNRLHPTQKPIALLEYLIKTYTNEYELVLDNCFGSCSTGIAAMNTNRMFYGIELDDDYFKIGSERMALG